MNLMMLIPPAAYFLGAIPFGFLLVKGTAGEDIRAVGSGNIGATNVFRRNRWAGIATLLCDGGKGYLAVLVAGWMGGDIQWQSLAAVAAILGHIYTVFLGFKGGKGVATGAGAYLALSPVPILIALIVFVISVALTKYVSLGSILATVSYPLWAYLLNESGSIILGAMVGSAFIIAKHLENIRRLASGKENKFAFGRRS